MNEIVMSQGLPKRLGYIDALRGTSMILVVFAHALISIGLPTDTTLIGAVCITFRMPLFFFISGYFAYRVASKWTAKVTKDVVGRKIKAQVIGTLFFYTLFNLCSQKPILLWLDVGFSWFWFTIALFQMFIIYLAISLICSKIKWGGVDTCLIIIALLLFYVHIAHPKFEWQVSKILEWFSLTEYFQFFVLGVLCRKHFGLFERLVNIDAFRAVVILTFFLSLLAIYGFDRQLLEYNHTLYRLIAHVIVRYSGLLSMFVLFYSCRDFFDKDNLASNALRFVGQRTLDIYMLHVFFMPSLFWLGAYLSDGKNMLLIQLTAGLVVAALDIMLCLIVSRLLRSSNLLGNWLFGVKPRS